MSKIESARIALIKRILQGDGKATRTTRKAAFDDRGLSGATQMLIDKVATSPHRVTDKDIEAAKASGLDEDEVFEVVICAAVGQATRQYDAGLAALKAVAMEDEHASPNTR